MGMTNDFLIWSCGVMWGDKFGNDTHVFVTQGSSFCIERKRAGLYVLRTTMNRRDLFVSYLLCIALSGAFQGSGKLIKVILLF